MELKERQFFFKLRISSTLCTYPDKIKNGRVRSSNSKLHDHIMHDVTSVSYQNRSIQYYLYVVQNGSEVLETVSILVKSS